MKLIKCLLIVRDSRGNDSAVENSLASVSPLLPAFFRMIGARIRSGTGELGGGELGVGRQTIGGDSAAYDAASVAQEESGAAG
jgi:hypothetical protein